QRRFRLSGRYRCPRSILHLETSALTCSPDHGAAMCELKFWTHGRCDSRPPPAAKRDRSKSLGRAASSLRRPRHALLKRDVVPEVLRGRLLLALGGIQVLPIERQTEILAAFLRNAHPAAKPILSAFDVDHAGVVAIFLVVRVLLVVAKQGAPVRIIVFHFRFPSAQDDRRRRCAEAPTGFFDETLNARAHQSTPIRLKRAASRMSRVPPFAGYSHSTSGSAPESPVIAAPVRAGAPTRAKAAAQADQRSCA